MAVKKHDASGTALSIWSAVPKENFMKNVQQILKNSHEVPGEFVVYGLEKFEKSSGVYQLPYEVEYQLVQDLAFIAVHEESAHAVAAATLLETAAEELMIHVSANSGVKTKVKDMFIKIGEMLEKCARKELSRQGCSDDIFNLLVATCEQRIISRLKCKDWIPPTYYSVPNKISKHRPMYEDIKDILSTPSWKRLQSHDDIDEITTRMRDFTVFLSTVDKAPGNLTFNDRREALLLAADVCKMDTTVSKILAKYQSCLSAISQKRIDAFDKVANCGHVSKRLASIAASKKFRRIFRSVKLRFVESYEPCVVLKRKRYVHAEIQLSTFHRVHRTGPLPRTIGTSKAACFLCNLFLSLEGKYTVSATHGRAFDAWTIPDILSYSELDRQEIKQIVKKMDESIRIKITKRTQDFVPFPVQSGIYNHTSLPSLGGTSLTGPASGVISCIPDVDVGSLSSDPSDLGVASPEQLPITRAITACNEMFMGHSLYTGNNETKTASFEDIWPTDIVKYERDQITHRSSRGNVEKAISHSSEGGSEFEHENQILGIINTAYLRMDTGSRSCDKNASEKSPMMTKKSKHKVSSKMRKNVNLRSQYESKSAHCRRRHECRAKPFQQSKELHVPDGKSKDKMRYRHAEREKRYTKRKRKLRHKKKLGIIKRLKVLVQKAVKKLCCIF